jgi:hypothetical protein
MVFRLSVDELPASAYEQPSVGYSDQKREELVTSFDGKAPDPVVS